MTLVEFVTAMLDRDEAVARKAAEASYDTEWREMDNVYGATEVNNLIAIGPWGGDLYDVGEHIARHDPARVLAAVVAARARLHLYDAVEMTDPTTAAMLRKTEALPYADDPDYDEAWRP